MENNTENFSQYCLIAGATDVGKKRSANEDYLGKADTPNGRVAVVCDGMGGHVGGATASHIAVETILDFMRENYRNDPREAIGEAIDVANQAILDYARTHSELTGMGSTCVLLLVRNGKVYVGHVGDSRIYLVRSKTICQLTVDHSFVQELVDAGTISKEQAEHHPRKNEITNALGVPNMRPATVRDEPISPEAGDVFLLCSDGLSNMVDDKHIAHIAGNLDMTTQQRANMLVQRANDNGGLDNITCVLIEFSANPETIGNDPFWKKKTFVIGAIASALLICCTVAWMLLKHPASKNPETPPAEDTANVMKDTTVELCKESVDLGKLKVGGDQRDLIAIDFSSCYPRIIDLTNGKALKSINELTEFYADSIKRSDETILDLMVSYDKKEVDLKLAKPARKLKSSLLNRKLHFSMQNESKFYDFSFEVEVVENTHSEITITNLPPEKERVGKDDVFSENVNDTIVVYVNKDDYRIVLCDQITEEDKADYCIEKKSHSFLEQNTDKGWYFLECNGQKCIVVIRKKTEIGFNATIPIKVRSGVEGEILLRVFQSSNN